MLIYMICHLDADQISNMAARANNVFSLVETLKILLLLLCTMFLF